MNTITIEVAGEEFEAIKIELTGEEVLGLYKLRKENSTKIAELEKSLASAEQSRKYSSDNLDKAKEEIEQAHTLLNALGTPDKTDHEESYYRKPLHIATRIALYIAGIKKP